MFRYDSGVDDNDRMLIFATQGNTEVLRPSGHWFMNGTLRLFQRYLTSFTLQADLVIPCVYALLPNKPDKLTEDHYVSCWKLIRNHPKFNFDRL